MGLINFCNNAQNLWSSLAAAHTTLCLFGRIRDNVRLRNTVNVGLLSSMLKIAPGHFGGALLLLQRLLFANEVFFGLRGPLCFWICGPFPADFLGPRFAHSTVLKQSRIWSYAPPPFFSRTAVARAMPSLAYFFDKILRLPNFDYAAVKGFVPCRSPTTGTKSQRGRFSFSCRSVLTAVIFATWQCSFAFAVDNLRNRFDLLTTEFSIFYLHVLQMLPMQINSFALPNLLFAKAEKKHISGVIRRRRNPPNAVNSVLDLCRKRHPLPS